MKTTQINKLNWMVKNLDVTTFRNGDKIPEAKTTQQWLKAAKDGKPAWCYYDNKKENGAKYGKLYNWYAINDKRGLAPKQYRLPSLDEVHDFIRNQDVEDLKAKDGWENYNDEYDNVKFGSGNNKSGFNLLPGGMRDSNGIFKYIGFNASFWVKDIPSDDVYNNCFTFYFGQKHGADVDLASEGDGFSVRCVLVKSLYKPVEDYYS